MAIIKTASLKIYPAVYTDPTIVTPNRMELPIRKYLAQIYLVNPVDNSETLITDYIGMSINSMDDNVFIERIIEPLSKTLLSVNLIAVREGSATVSAYYTLPDNTIVTGEAEIVVYEPWFRENYWRLITEFDVKSIGVNKYDPSANLATMADCTLKACFEMYDVLWAYNKDISNITDPMLAKNKFLDSIGKTRGLPKTDFSQDNTEMEYFASKLYRELLNNLYDLLQVRGTQLSYEMFFGALGYDIQLLEFWYNENGLLVEINPNDTIDKTLSTFNIYDETGRIINNDTMKIDPRFLVNSTNNYNFCNKSIYIKPVFSPKTGYDFGTNSSYSISQRNLINRYLDFLRPQHIQYLSSSLEVDIERAPNEVGEFLFNGLWWNQNNSISGKEDWGYVSLGTYLFNNAPMKMNQFLFVNGIQQHTSLPYFYGISATEDPTGRLLLSDPGRLEYDGNQTHGTWQESGGGFCIETLWNIAITNPSPSETLKSWTDQFIFSTPIKISDIIATRLKYDAKPPYTYDGTAPFRYDTGYALVESVSPNLTLRTDGITVFNVKSFQSEYNSYIALGMSDIQVKAVMGAKDIYNGISDKNFNYILTL